MRAADELTGTNTLTDETWTRVRAHLDDQQVLDLIFTVGCYQLLAVAVNAPASNPSSIDRVVVDDGGPLWKCNTRR